MIYDTHTDLAEPSMSGEETHSVWEQGEEDFIDHVIFVIHGIGQQTERFGYFEQHMETIRKTICEVLQARMPHRDIRIQLIPIEWHKHIHEETDDCLNNISLSTIPGMRLISNDYMMDALYYLAKDRQQSIVTHVTRCFNDSYHEFMDAHPAFNGNIGIFGYSLGGLITWDILAHQRTVETVEEQDQLDKLNLVVPRLEFKPHFLFGVGCPLGGFLNIRNQDPKLYHPDNSTIFENIYHPCDPLAYRVEPLYHPDCRHHDSIRVETAIVPASATPFISSLTDWMTSWFKKSNDKSTQELSTLCTPQPSRTNHSPTGPQHIPQQTPPTVNNPLTINTPPSVADIYDNNYITDLDNLSHSPLTIDSRMTRMQDNHLPSGDNDTDKTTESGDRGTLLSSVGALFQYISPRTSFDRDSAIGSDIDDEEEDEINYYASKSDKHIRMKKSTRCMNTPPPGITAAMNDPNMLYRRRQSQIYEASPRFSTQQKRRQSQQPLSPASSLEENTMLLESLPGQRRLDYSLEPEPLLGGVVSNQYLLGLQAHFSYWNNKDMLWRMVYQLDNATH
ncbi:DDHD domain-containing protein [Chlamydoabsidia padenii]|nr:DDHD domain-containing protein [Chlamydoabsidia padenii]